MSAIMQKENGTARPEAAKLQTQDRPFVSPKVNIVETKEAYVLEAEMPGVAKEGLDINLEDNVLTIIGRRAPEPSVAWLYHESHQADYRRVFELDPSIDSGKLSAQVEQGILTLTLPKAERVKPRRIQVS